MLSYADMTPSGRRYFEEIEVGEEFESPGRTVTETDIVLFAGLSGDYNVLHTDAEFMKKSIFGERIAQDRLLHELGVGVEHVVVAGQPGEEDDVGLGHRSPGRLELLTDLDLLEVAPAARRHVRVGYHAPSRPLRGLGR